MKQPTKKQIANKHKRVLEDSYSSEEEKVNSGFGIDTSKINATPYQVMKSMQGSGLKAQNDEDDGQLITDFNKLSMQGKCQLLW